MMATNRVTAWDAGFSTVNRKKMVDHRPPCPEAAINSPSAPNVIVRKKKKKK